MLYKSAAYVPDTTGTVMVGIGVVDMRTEKAIALVQRYQHELSDLYRQAAGYGWSHKQILERKGTKILGREDYQKLPRWASAQIEGWDRCLFDSLYYGGPG